MLRLISFAGGGFAKLVYSGYAHFDSDRWQDWIGELGSLKDPEIYGGARRSLVRVSTPEEEARLKSGRTYGAIDAPPPAPHSEHFGPVIVSCDRADLRITPMGLQAPDDSAAFVLLFVTNFAGIHPGWRAYGCK